MEKNEAHNNWYAIVTKSRAEKKFNERAVQLGLVAYLPLQTTYRQWSDRKKKVTLPLIPSIVFVKLSPKDFNVLYDIPGFVRVFKYLGKPAIIKEVEIQNLRILTQDHENIQVSNSINLTKGTVVKVVKGPFTGLMAECLQFQGSHRIIVRTEALGVVLEVNVPLSFVEEVTVA